MPEADENFAQREPNWIIQFFAFRHLPGELADISEDFFKLAWWADQNLPDNPEKDKMLSLLLQAKDCAVRAKLFR
jgi:ferritin-like protein